MLISYFLTRMYYYFFVFCCLFSIIFSVSNILSKMAFISIFAGIPFLFVTILPLMLLFSIPIASSLAVYFVVYTSVVSHEFLFVQFFHKAKRALLFSIVFFSTTLIPFYIPLIFQWAPSAYLSSKQLIFDTAKYKLFYLQENTLHVPIPGTAIFFKKKRDSMGKFMLYKLFFSFYDKHKEHYLFSAKKGFLSNTKLHLEKGTSLYINQRNEKYYAVFNETIINLDTIFYSEKNDSQKIAAQPKFLIWEDFFTYSKENDKKIIIEWHKRIVQIIWLWLFPLLSFLGIILIMRIYRATYITGIIITGVLFFLMYASLTLGQTNFDHLYVNIFVMYATVLLVPFVGFLFYKKNKI